MGAVVDWFFTSVRHFLLELLTCLVLSWLLSLGAAA